MGAQCELVIEAKYGTVSGKPECAAKPGMICIMTTKDAIPEEQGGVDACINIQARTGEVLGRARRSVAAVIRQGSV